MYSTGPTCAVTVLFAIEAGTPVAVSNISFVGVNQTAGTSTTVPASIADDIALLGAARVLDSTVPTVPTTSPTWDAPPDDADRDLSISGATGGAFVRYKYPTVSGETTGVCTDANAVLAAVYRGVHLTTPIIAMKFATGNGTSINFPALTYTSATAWIAIGYRHAGSTTATPGGGLTERTLGANRGWFDSNGQLSSFSGVAFTIPAAQNWVCWSIAIETT